MKITKRTLVILLTIACMAVAHAAITDLAARAKSGKVQLTWTHQGPGSSYDVYRRLVPATALTFIGTTTSDYSTFLDTNVINDNTYCYQVEVDATLSNEACATPQARRRR